MVERADKFPTRQRTGEGDPTRTKKKQSPAPSPARKAPPVAKPTTPPAKSSPKRRGS